MIRVISGHAGNETVRLELNKDGSFQGVVPVAPIKQTKDWRLLITKLCEVVGVDPASLCDARSSE